jgi:hypothetical protein
MADDYEDYKVGNRTAMLQDPALKAHNRERLALLERQIGETDRLIGAVLSGAARFCLRSAGSAQSCSHPDPR